MSNQRRQFLKKTAVLSGAALAIKTHSVLGQSLTAGFTSEQTAKNAKIIDSNKIEMKLAKFAEKGTAIPITVTSSLESIQSISILVEKNPIPLVATFKLSSELETLVSARLEMAETSNVVVLVETLNGIYRATQQVKISIGGCGI